MGGPPQDVYQAKLVMLKGIKVIEKEPKKPTSSKRGSDNKTVSFSREDSDGIPAGMMEALQSLIAQLEEQKQQ